MRVECTTPTASAHTVRRILHGENLKFDLRWMDSLQTVRHVQQAGRDKSTDKKNAKISERRVAQNIAD